MPCLRRLLVTGGCGFIGSNAINHFVRDKGWYVVNVDRLDYCGKEEHVDAAVRASDDYAFVRGDINDEALLLRLLCAHNIDTVVHFAAQSHVDRSFDDPRAFVRDNVEGTVSVLQAARAYGKLGLFVHVSTDEVYGEQRDRKRVAEDAQLHPSNPYSASKAAAEHFVQAYATSFGIPAIITRANNVFGRNQHEEKVVPRFIALLREEAGPFTIHGSGDQTRSFLYAEDAARAFSAVIEKGRVGEAYNIEASEDHSIRELANALVRVSGLEHPGFCSIPDRPFNDMCYLVDGTKLRAHTGWVQSTPFEEGLRATWNSARL